MSIENISGPKIVGKIDLSRFEKSPKAPAPETYLPALEAGLQEMAKRLNSRHGNFLEPNGQMIMSGEDEASDRALIAAKEKAWASESGKTVEAMAADRAKNPANIAEVAATLLFDKVLGEEFIVVRASAYDDYENGADQLIIDKRTGAVICGLDDVIGRNGDDGGEKKKKKMDEKMKNGGAKIKYGATMDGEHLERKSLRHIPIFYFGLSKGELDALLASLAKGDLRLSEAEKGTYAKMVDSLLAQAAEYGADANLHEELKDNLRGLAPSLQKMKNHIVE